MKKWVENVCGWANDLGIEKYNIPRNEDELLNLKHLSFESISYFEKEKFITLPIEIGNLTNLVFLELGSAVHPEILLNDLIEIPKQIGGLTALTHFYIQFNSLSELPKEIGSLTKLKEFKLGGNKLTRIPKEIGQLTELEILTIWNNELTELPHEIGQLRNLIGLDISSNAITSLPNEITKLIGLKRFYYGNKKLQLNKDQVKWLFELKKNGCDIYPDVIRLV